MTTLDASMAGERVADVPVADRSTLKSNLAASACVCTAVVVLLPLLSVNVLHWSLAPILLCGVVIGADAVAWVRQQVDVFDPKGLIGLLGLHFFFLSPLLQIAWEMPLLGKVPDPRPWLGVMAILNFAGLLVYFGARKLGQRGVPTSERYCRQIHRGRAGIILPIAIAVCAAAQVFVFIRFGGISGMIRAKEQVGPLAVARGTGVPKMLGRALPMLLLILLTYLRGIHKLRRSTFLGISTVLGFLVVVQFIIGGLRGSRSATLFALLGLGGVLHFFWRRVTAKHVVLALIPLLGFMYLYGFYKTAGSRAFGLFTGEATVEELVQDTGRTFRGMVLGDMSRADMQGYELYVLQTHPEGYDLRWGKTYWTSFNPLFPSWIWSNKPPAEKVIAGADMIWGKGFYDPTNVFRKSSRVYGLAGEAMLNFSWPAVPVVFGVWGFLVGRLRRRLLWRVSGDARFLVTAYVSLMCVLLLMSDLDNIVAFVWWYIFAPLVVVRLISVRVPVVDDQPAERAADVISPGELMATQAAAHMKGQG